VLGIYNESSFFYIWDYNIITSFAPRFPSPDLVHLAPLLHSLRLIDDLLFINCCSIICLYIYIPKGINIPTLHTLDNAIVYIFSGMILWDEISAIHRVFFVFYLCAWASGQIQSLVHIKWVLYHLNKPIALFLGVGCLYITKTGSEIMNFML